MLGLSCPARIAAGDRIIKAIPIPIRSHARFGRVEPVGRHEPSERRIVEPGVQVLQAGLGVEFLADVALALGKPRELLAEGLVVGPLGLAAGRVGDQAHRGEVVAVHPGGDGADALGFGGEVLGPGPGRPVALEIVAEVERRTGGAGLFQPRAVGGVGVDDAVDAVARFSPS